MFACRLLPRAPDLLPPTCDAGEGQSFPLFASFGLELTPRWWLILIFLLGFDIIIVVVVAFLFIAAHGGEIFVRGVCVVAGARWTPGIRLCHAVLPLVKGGAHGRALHRRHHHIGH